jgi:hypothetical protein
VSSQSGSNTGGIGFTGLLTIVFIVLKLLHKITWSWVWVLAPLWIGAAISVPVLLVVGIYVWRTR